MFYDLLFRISAAATQQLAADPRFISEQIGMIGVLHTWGRNFVYHPHGHYLVPAGGLAPDGSTWLPARKKFLLPVRALSRLFRGKLHQALRNETCYSQIPDKVWKQDWVVHCEEVGSGLGALKYLAPYIFRVSIPTPYIRICMHLSNRVWKRYGSCRKVVHPVELQQNRSRKSYKWLNNRHKRFVKLGNLPKSGHLRTILDKCVCPLRYSPLTNSAIF
jgi:hypothetical protein